MESTPYFAFIQGFMNRQPSVVSSIFREREYALSALPITKGARDMLSTPPAMTRSDSPHLIARAAVATASMLEPQSRLTVVPGPSLRKPPTNNPIHQTFPFPHP